MQNIYILIFSLLFIIIIFSIIIIIRKLIKLQKSNVLDDLESEVNDLILELNQTADRNINILEEKITTLITILKDADKRIKLLSTESGRNKSEYVTYNQLGLIQENKKMKIKTGKKQPEVIVEPVFEEIIKGKDKKDIIIGLHNNGFTSAVIASRVGLTVGEVELIISLIEGK